MNLTSDTDVSKVEGNVSPEIKRAVLDSVQYLGTKQVSPSTGKQLRVFETELVSRLHLTEVSVLPKAEEPGKLEARVVFEVIADECTTCSP
jgi:acyl-coenzyme A thioesterase 13